MTPSGVSGYIFRLRKIAGVLEVFLPEPQGASEPNILFLSIYSIAPRTPPGRRGKIEGKIEGSSTPVGQRASELTIY